MRSRATGRALAQEPPITFSTPVPRAPTISLPADARVWLTGDIHLTPEDDARSRFFLDFLRQARAEADRLVLFGDVFDYWIGPAFGYRCSYGPVLDAFRAARAEGFPIDFIAGNRDFMGPGELRRMGLSVFGDAVIYDRGGGRTLVTHGDLLVSGDVRYRRFRLWVRSWPLRLGYRLVPQHARLAMALYMRGRSKTSLAQVKQTAYPVDAALAARWLRHHDAQELLMGHLHREELHDHGAAGRSRVMPGWTGREAPYFVLGPPSELASYALAPA